MKPPTNRCGNCRNVEACVEVKMPDGVFIWRCKIDDTMNRSDHACHTGQFEPYRYDMACDMLKPPAPSTSYLTKERFSYEGGTYVR